MRKALVILAFAALTAVPAHADDICHITDPDAFLERCPTNDPALGRILSDFTIERDGVPVTFSSASCVEPVSTLPLTQYNDQLALLQTLRTIYYLDGDRCNDLPWTPLSLYEWLHSKIDGFDIDSSATFNQCCETTPDGRHLITLATSNDTNLEYHRTWEGVAEFITLIMHEARHRDGFGHSSCCPVGANACDDSYDETNLSPYAIQYWLEKSFVDGTIHTGYTCLSATRVEAIKSWIRGAANNRVNRFCTNPPLTLTDGNNAPPPCDSTCAATLTCIAPAHGVPPVGGPPVWWSTSPPQPVYHDRLDDPRWAGASKITYGDGTGETADFRFLHDPTYLYFSWRAFVAPASSADQNTLYVGFQQPGGGDVIVKFGLTGTPSALTADATHLSIEAFLRNADATQGAPITVPSEITSTARVWVDPASPGSWAIQFRLPKTAVAMTCGRFKLWYELLAGTPTAPVTAVSWPRSGADVDGGTIASPHPLHYPDPALWQWLRPSDGPSDRACPVAGVSLSYNNIGTKNTPSSQINYGPATPINTLFARPTNNSGAVIPTGSILATFRIANWGSVPGDWEAGVPASVLWSAIPGGTDVPLSGPLPDLTTADESNEAHFDWAVTGSDLVAFMNGERRSHQCMLVELKSVGTPGVTFTNTSVYRNMDFVSASVFRRDATLSVKGLEPLSSQPRDVYLYVEAQMPAPSRLAQRDALPTHVEAESSVTPPNAFHATYRVHVYHDTGRTITIDGIVRPILRYQTSFGYNVTHQGELESWRHRIDGSGLVELAPGWYKIPVPNQGSTTVTETIEAIEPRHWALSLHLGTNHPLDPTSHTYAGRYGGGIDLEYRPQSMFAVELFVGRDRMSADGTGADLAVTHLSVSGKRFFGSTSLRGFVEAGLGAYSADPGSTRLGFVAGGGVEVAITSRFALEFTANEHVAGTGSDRLRYVTTQAGVRFGL